MNRNRIWSIPIKMFLTIGIVALGFTGCTDTGTDGPLTPQAQQEMMVLGKDNPGIQRAMEVQDKYTSALMRTEDVIGTATGVDEEGVPVVLVLTKHGVARNLPTVLEGVPVRPRQVGEIVAFQYLPSAKGGNPGPPGGGGGGGSKINPKKFFTRPVPIGVSTGNMTECSAGTIACRVKNAGEDVFALSNNHVYALENNGSIGDPLVQPGLYDRHCRVNTGDIFASLSDFYPIVFSSSANNTMDAAVGLTSTANLGNGTPSDGYGMPSSATVAPALNMAVQKYGRTTGLTAGTITGINATILVGYGTSGTARFIDQVVVTPGTFSAGGDSGSLIVTNDANANPVALLFAGSSFDTIGSPIGPVLTRFGVTIDGK